MIEKSKVFSPVRSRTGMNQSSKYLFPLFTGILVFGFVFFYMRYYQTLLSKDRSENYNVKVIPINLDDSNLAELDKQVFSYLAVIDAGSSGCRAHVYRYGKLGSLTGPLYVLPQHQSQKVKPGLSSFANSPMEAGPSLSKLIDFIKTQVPENLWKDTPIWLKATAGLRLLEKSASDAVLLSVRQFLKDPQNSPFIFKSSYASIISGNEEGAFGWIAFNYLKKVIGPRKTGNVLPFAVVEMGGASSQVSQLVPTLEEVEKIPQEYRYSFNIEEEPYHLYAYSYLGYGAEQGREALNSILASKKQLKIEDPCLNKGFNRDGSVSTRKETYEGVAGNVQVQGASTANSCRIELTKIFNKDKSCPKTKGPYSFQCVYQPEFVITSPNFLVFENFYYVSSGIGVKSEPDSGVTKFPLMTTPSEIENAARKVCNSTWSQVQQGYPVDDQSKDNNIKWCFSSSYAASFLIDGLGLPADKRITVQKFVDGSEIEWALGAALKEASDFLKRTNLRQN